MSRTSTSFEESIRQTLENFELPYESSGWTSLEKRMIATAMAGNTASAARWIAFGAAAVVTVLIGYSVYQQNFDIPEAKLADTSSRFVSELGQVSGTDSFEARKTFSSENGELAAQETGSVNQLNPLTGTSNNTLNQSEQSASGNVVQMQQFPVNQAGDSNESVTDNGQKSTLTNTNKSTTASESKGVFNSDVRQACVGYDVSFKLADTPTKGSYLWNFGDGTFSSKPNATHTYTKPGVYDVSLSITSDEDGSIKSTTMENLITINPTPDADFEWNFINRSTEAPTVKFVNLSSNANQSIWTFDSGEASKEISPEQAFVNKGKYTVELFVKNEYGCTDTKVKYVTINSDYNLLAPEKFSPNGDGEEDTFMPEALRANNFNFKLAIYNEAGMQVFETSNKHKAWEGKLPDGSLAKDFTHYNWVVILYNEITKEDRYFSGTLTVIP